MGRLNALPACFLRAAVVVTKRDVLHQISHQPGPGGWGAHYGVASSVTHMQLHFACPVPLVDLPCLTSTQC